MKRNSPIWLDIETGGTDSTKSSILSIASGQQGNIKSSFNTPVAGSFLSSFSEREILPQLRRAGKLGTERSSIESLIGTLEKNPEAPIAGYNIRGFDLGFVQKRSRQYGLENKFVSALGNREIQDPVQQSKDLIARSIKGHLERGTFDEVLGMPWEQAKQQYKGAEDAPLAFKRLIQVETYKLGDQSSMFAGYKLTDVHALQSKKYSGAAHEAAADLEMTSHVWEGLRSGEIEKNLSSPDVARSWLNRVVERSGEYSASGRLLSKSDIEGMGLIKKPVWKNPWVVGGGIVGAAAVYAAARFSGDKDEYNTIEGMKHGGMAHRKRLELTPFGSPADLGKAVKQAETLYKSITKQLLTEKGIEGVKIIGGASDKGDAISLFAKDASGKTLISFNRTFTEKSVDLGNIFIDESIRGGFGRRFYEQEADIFRHIGYGGDTVTSTVVSPMTAKMQNRMYRSMPEDPDHMKIMPDILGGKLKKEDFLPGMFSMVGKIPERGHPFDNIEGMGHKGIAQWFRKLFTPHGSKWDSMRNLVQGTETFTKMLESTGFQKALQSAIPISKLGQGAMGQAWRMRTEFRGKSFDFVRKIGDIGEDEGAVMKMFQNKFSPSFYGEGTHEGRPFLDMELIQGKSGRALQKQGKLTDVHVSDIRQNLQEMHNIGVGHGDLHLGNTVVTPQGQTAIIDYGTSGRLGGGFRSNSKEGMFELRVNEQDFRSVEGDIRRLNEALDVSPVTPPTPQVSNSPGTPLARRKRNQAQLQQAASATSWEAGTKGGRRSRM